MSVMFQFHDHRAYSQPISASEVDIKEKKKISSQHPPFEDAGVGLAF